MATKGRCGSAQRAGAALPASPARPRGRRAPPHRPGPEVTRAGPCAAGMAGCRQGGETAGLAWHGRERLGPTPRGRGRSWRRLAAPTGSSHGVRPPSRLTQRSTNSLKGLPSPRGIVLKRTGQASRRAPEGKSPAPSRAAGPGSGGARPIRARGAARPALLRPGRGACQRGKGSGDRRTHGAVGSTKLPRLRVRWAERRRRSPSSAVEPHSARSGPAPPEAARCRTRGAAHGRLPVRSLRSAAPERVGTPRVSRTARTPPGSFSGTRSTLLRRAKASQDRAGG